MERKLRLQLMTAFADIGKIASDAHEEGRDVEGLRLNIVRSVRNVMEPHYRAVMEAFGTRILRNRKADTNFERYLDGFLREVGGNRITNVSNTTIKSIRRIIVKSQENGEGTRATSKAIFEGMRGAISKRRSALIARTETHSAASYANHRMNESLQLPNQKKRWVAVNDNRSRHWHKSMDGVEVGIDEDFEVVVKGVTYKMKHTGDPRGGASNVINCRCVTIYIDPDDEVVDDKPPPDKPIVSKPPKPEVIVTQPVQTNERLKLIGNVKFENATEELKIKFEEKLNNKLSPLALVVANKVAYPSIIKNSEKGVYFRNGKRIKSGLERNTLEHEYGHHVDHVSSGTNFVYRSQLDDNFQDALIEDGVNLGFSTRLSGTDYLGHLKFRAAPKTEQLMNEMKKKLMALKTIERTRLNGVVDTEKSWEPKFDGATSISDIVDATTKGNYQDKFYTWGHGRKYYRREGSAYYETFANLYAIHGNQKAMSIARELFPNTVREFERMLKEIADGKAVGD